MSTRRRGSALLLAALSGGLLSCADDTGGGSDAPVSAADTFLAAAAADGLVVDEQCVANLAGQLSASDAAAVVEAGPDGTPEDLSEQGVAIVDRLLTCADRGALAEVIIADLEDLGSDVDDECVRDVIADLDLDAAVAGGGDDAVFEAIVRCAG